MFGVCCVFIVYTCFFRWLIEFQDITGVSHLLMEALGHMMSVLVLCLASPPDLLLTENM